MFLKFYWHRVALHLGLSRSSGFIILMWCITEEVPNIWIVICRSWFHIFFPVMIFIVFKDKSQVRDRPYAINQMADGGVISSLRSAKIVQSKKAELHNSSD